MYLYTLVSPATVRLFGLDVSLANVFTVNKMSGLVAVSHSNSPMFFVIWRHQMDFTKPTCLCLLFFPFPVLPFLWFLYLFYTFVFPYLLHLLLPLRTVLFLISFPLPCFCRFYLYSSTSYFYYFYNEVLGRHYRFCYKTSLSSFFGYDCIRFVVNCSAKIVYLTKRRGGRVVECARLESHF